MRRLAALASCALLAACAATASIPTTDPTGAAERIPAAIYRPEGAGPFPAVVLLHGCGGVGSGSSGWTQRWAEELRAHGYVVLVPDTFSARGFPGGVCADPSRGPRVSPGQQARDAYAALAYLRTLAYVDSARVGLMGGSYGGLSTLIATAARPDQPRRTGFSAAIAFYPECAARLGGWRADATGVYRPLSPLLILVGELDDWTPVEPCRKLAAAAREAGYPVAIKVYPGSHHGFDGSSPLRRLPSVLNSNASGGHGATIGGNPEAWADSIREVLAFFARNLGPGL